MKKIIAVLFIAAVPLILTAQKKDLTIEESILNRAKLMPQGLAQLGWIKGTENYYYVDYRGTSENLLYNTAGKKGDDKIIISLQDLNEKVSALKLNEFKPFSKFPVITWKNANEFTFQSGKYILTYNTGTRMLTSKDAPVFSEKAENLDESKASGNVAFTIDNNLFIQLPSGTAPSNLIQVTHDKDINIVNGHIVHREEFGIDKGTFWSPSGKLLAYYRMDQTMVTDYPILELSNQPATVRMIKYPMAGAKSHHVSVIIYNTETGKQVTLNTGEPQEQYLTNVAWSPDNQHIYIAILNRDQNHLKMNRYNAATGAFEATLFEEKDDKYVQPLHPMMFVPGHPDQFIWQSEKEGVNALYLYNTKGELIRRLTPLADNKAQAGLIVTDVLGFDPKGTAIYYQAVPFGNITREIYKTELSGSPAKLISRANGSTRAIFCDNFKWFISDHSSSVLPREQSVYSESGNVSRVLKTSDNPLLNYNTCEMKLFRIKAADGTTDLWCRMFLPANFDSTKKYPSLTYLYNGPNAQMITNTWLGGADLFLYYMAQKGFVVFTVDGRGSENRGKDFEQATFRKLGDVEMADQEKGNQYLRSLKYINPERMAVYGWSYGGFMTTSLMTRKPGLYKTGVAGGPVIDWSYYEIMYTERYMDTPQTNPEGYKNSNLMNYIGNLKGNLLLIHGTSDDVVVWQHSLMYIKGCVDQGKQSDYYVYPGHLHNVRGKDRIHLLTKIADYVISNT